MQSDVSSYCGWKETSFPCDTQKEHFAKIQFSVWNSCPSTRKWLDGQQLTLDWIISVWKKCLCALLNMLDSFRECLIDDVNVPERRKKVVIPGWLSSTLQPLEVIFKQGNKRPPPLIWYEVAGSRPTYVHLISTHVELCPQKLVFDFGRNWCKQQV